MVALLLALAPAPPAARISQTVATTSDTIIEFDDDEYAAILEPSPRRYVDLIALPEPSDLARRYLFPTEKFRGEWRRHWFRLVKELAIVLGLVLLLQSGYRAQFGSVVIDLDELLRLENQLEFGGVVIDLALQPVAEIVSQSVWILLVVWRFAAWWTTRLVLTHKRVMVIRGVWWRRVSSLSLATARDLRYTQTPLARMLGYGAIRFRTSALVRPRWGVGDLPSPTDLYLQIVEEIFEPEASEARRRPARIDDGLGLLTPPQDRLTTFSGFESFDLEDGEAPLVISPTPPRPRRPPPRLARPTDWPVGKLDEDDPIEPILFEDFGDVPDPSRHDGDDGTDR